ncbi:MAG: M28 family peptidase [Bacteroidota bacterium]
MNISLLKTSLFLCAALFCCACDKPLKNGADNPQPDTPAVAKSAKTIPQFDSQRAYDLIQKQVDFGPRVPNTKAHNDCRDFLKSELEQYADTVIIQSFQKQMYGTNLKLTNIIGSFSPEKTNRVVLCAHWDSRPRAEEDSVPANRVKGIPAANDGGSGVAVLLELARLFKTQQPDVGIDIVLFDAEDYAQATKSEDYSQGAQYYVANMPVARPRYAILLDIVGDKEAFFPMEANSYQSSPALVEQIWRVGMEHGNGLFQRNVAGPVTDDHIPFIRAGIPAVDIIDLEMVGNNSPKPRRRYWHTQYDTMDNIGKETLNGVGKTLLNFLFTYGNNF